MPRSPHQSLARCLQGIILPVALSGTVLVSAAPAAAADLPFRPSQAAAGTEFRSGDVYQGAGGFRVARVPVRPAPIRYDIYGYPLLMGGPNPLASGSGCPAVLTPDFDPDGNFAGYAPVPMCR
ncbi:MAG: hypothetical protein ACRYGP_11015 [Janthinobacterium lividum]